MATYLYRPVTQAISSPYRLPLFRGPAKLEAADPTRAHPGIHFHMIAPGAATAVDQPVPRGLAVALPALFYARGFAVEQVVVYASV